MKFRALSTATIIKALVVGLLFFILPIAFYNAGYTLLAVIALILVIVVDYWFFYKLCFDGIIIINEAGVRYKSQKNEYFFEWDDIQKIGIAKVSHARSDAECIYFIKKGMPPPMPLASIKLVSENFIFVQYRKKIVDKIRLYWKQGAL